MTDHTPEPWKRVGRSYRIQVDEKFYLVPKWTGTVTEADARRISEIVDQVVSSVNACASRPTEQLGDVAELAECLRLLMFRTRGIWENGGSAMEARMRKSTRDRCRAALAPFLKGDTDEK